MIGIHIIAVGKLKEAYLRDASKEYEKRLGAFCKLTLTEISPARLPDEPKEAEIHSALEKEAQQILQKVGKGDYVIPLCIEGKMLSSPQMADKISDLAAQGKGNFTFIIGGSFGLSDQVKRRGDFSFSMSPLTFPHQLARVMLLEQIYRFLSISSGGKYHK